MKKLIIIVSLIIMLVVSASRAQTQITIDPEIRSAITKILSKPMKVFKLDLTENERSFDLMDKWFEKHIDIKKAISRKSKKKDRVSFKLKVQKNIPVSSTGKALKGVEVKRAFNILYIKEPQKRRFIKELRVPSRRSLPDEEVIKTGVNFIKNNKFCKITESDKIGTPLVISRKRHELRPETKQNNKLTIYQRVELKREFFGFEVINSKQTVDIHPDTREIISYKNIRWTPVDEISGESMPYFLQEEVIKKIKPTDKYKAVKVKAGMFQTDKIIFPVLVVYTERLAEKPEGIPEERVLVINLVKDLDLEKEKKDERRPKKAKK